MKPLNLLMIMDPIEAIAYHKDSSLAMLWAAQDRGHRLFVCHIEDLRLLEGQLWVDAQAIEVFKDPKQFFVKQAVNSYKVTDFDAILMRKDPPFDLPFLYATHLLDHAKQAGVLVVNDPTAIRSCNEKLFATWFSQYMTPTLVSSSLKHLKAFINEHKDVIVKPLDGMGGSGIFRLTAQGPNIGACLEMLTQQGTLPIMAQRYIAAISEGDKRVLIVDGEVVPYALARIPADGETRGNLAAGGRGVAMPLTDQETAVALAVAPIVKQKGLMFVGLDLIGGMITEINVTSPTCVREIDTQCGTHIAEDLITAIESKL